MRFLCDVHISLKLVSRRNSLRYSSMHGNKMPDKWHTTDKNICDFADASNLVVTTKDSDFKDRFFTRHSP